MKNRKFNWKHLFSLLTTIICCTGLLLPVQTTPPPQKDPDKPKQSQMSETREYVEVVNVSLVVRALKKGQPVAGLQQKDFTLYENGKPRTLTSFQEIRRKVGQHTGDESTRIEEKTTPAQVTKNRLFFFYFHISEPDTKIPKTLDYFFRQVYRKGDYALLMVGNRLFRIADRSRVKPVLTSFNTLLTQLTEKKRRAKQQLTDHLDRLAREFIEEINKDRAILMPNLTMFVSRFKLVQQEYQQGNISLAEENLKAIVASLKKIDIEKWGFVFYQEERHPFFRASSLRARKVSKMQMFEIQRYLEEEIGPKISSQQSVQTIKSFQQAFIEANVTLHLLLSDPTSMGKQGSNYLKHTVAHTDWQQAFRGISQASGGGTIVDNNFQESMAQAVEREDVFYRLTYAPDTEGKERRNIRIQTKLPGIKLQYHRKVTVSPADKIAVDLFSFNHPLLEFTVKNYHQFFDGNRLYGDIEIKITSVDSKNNRRTFEKILAPIKEEMAISMNLDFPSGGDFNLIIEANDRQTSQTATVNKKITIPQNKYQLEPVLVTEASEGMNDMVDQNLLDSLLKKSARYCEKLKKTTFHFNCTEEVTDSHWLEGDILRDNHYFYNYRIIREGDGKLDEDRKLKPESMELIEKRRKELGIAGDRQILLTNFFSSYPFLKPVSMLAEENQSKYRYRLLSTKAIAGKTLYKVSVEPKQEGIMEKDSNYGIVWIDEEDGSVYKIQLGPNSLNGLETLKQVARQKRNRLKVLDVHSYEVKRKGIRFPSHTEINCSFLDWEQAKRETGGFPVDALEKVGTVYEYKKYQFINVNVDVVESEPR
ncbi:hypothetical protein ACFLQP_02315 [Acidobacteriota bacterium]